MITKLDKNEIFVFGSNLAGRHGAGAAKQAMKWGAKYGQWYGLQGQTFAIPTKDENIQTLPLIVIQKYVDNFIDFADKHQELKFLVTPIGTGLAGIPIENMAKLFVTALLYDNIVLPEEFLTILNKND